MGQVHVHDGAGAPDTSGHGARAAAGSEQAGSAAAREAGERTGGGAGKRKRTHTGSYDEASRRSGPRRAKVAHIADARGGGGALVARIQIGPRMVGMIEDSARHAVAAEAEARQHRQVYDDGG